jgi:hypothetical protein
MKENPGNNLGVIFKKPITNKITWNKKTFISKN